MIDWLQASGPWASLILGGTPVLCLGLRSRRPRVRAACAVLSVLFLAACLDSYGQDPDAVDAEIALDKENRARLGIVCDGDPEQVSFSGAAQPSAEVTASDPDQPARP